jgi:hypothetical protein
MAVAWLPELLARHLMLYLPVEGVGDYGPPRTENLTLVV